MNPRLESDDDGLYDFNQAGSDVDSDVFEDNFVKLEWNQERDGDKAVELLAQADRAVQVEKVMDHRDVKDPEGELRREYKVKWKLWSHLHDSYHTEHELRLFVDGEQQVATYLKKLKKLQQEAFK